MAVNPDVSRGGISLMMPAYNAEAHIAQAIESAIAQSVPTWELVVVDDGSTDRTGEIARSYGDPRIRVIRRDNGGEAAARNTALDHLRGQYLAFLDADDLLLPHHVETMVGFLQAHPDHVGAYTDGYYITEDGRRLKPLSSRRRGPFSGWIFDEVLRGSDCFGPPLSVVLRRAPIQHHQLRFAEDVGLGTDWDFFLRVADIGTFGYVDEVTCLYRLHQTNLTRLVGSSNRVAGYTKCRLNGVKMKRFATCPVELRVHVFYDLLAHLLRDEPERQQVLVESPEFLALPRAERARLLRLMASKAIISDSEPRWIRRWFERSRKANWADARGAALSALYRLSPSLCRTILRRRTRDESDMRTAQPFADLDTSNV